MIADHRPDTLTPALKAVAVKATSPARAFTLAAPELLAAARRRDPRMALLAREATRGLMNFDCPQGVPFDDGSLVGVLAMKLQSPNKHRFHWSMQAGESQRWERELRKLICKATGIPAWAGVVELGRQPRCAVKMAVQLVRLVASSREFIRDDDNLASSRKCLTDAMKRVGLLKEDRREWLDAGPDQVLQDVSISGHALTVVCLWPAEQASLVSPLSPVGAPNVPESR